MLKHIIQTNIQLYKAKEIVLEVLYVKTHSSLPPALKAMVTCELIPCRDIGHASITNPNKQRT